MPANRCRRSAASLDRTARPVQQFAQDGSARELLAKATSRESKPDEFAPCLHQCWNEVVTGAAALHAELRERAGSAAASRPSAAMCGHSGRQVTRPTRPRRSRGAARSPAGC